MLPVPKTQRKTHTVELVFIEGPRLCGKTQVALEYPNIRGSGNTNNNGGGWRVLGLDELPSTLTLHRRNKLLWTAMRPISLSNNNNTPSPTTTSLVVPVGERLVSLVLDVDGSWDTSTRAATISYLRGRIVELALTTSDAWVLKVTVVRVSEGPSAPISLDAAPVDRGVGGHYGGKVRHQLLGYALADHALRLSLDVQQVISAHKVVNQGNTSSTTTTADNAAAAAMITIDGDVSINNGDDDSTAPLTNILKDMSVIGHIYSASASNKGNTNAELQQQGVDQVESVRVVDRLNDLPRRYYSEHQRCLTYLPAHRQSFFTSTMNGPRVSALFVPVSSLLALASMSKESGKEAVLRRLRSGSRHLTGQAVLEPIGLPTDATTTTSTVTTTAADGVYPVLDDTTVELMWQWMLGVDQHQQYVVRRAVVICGDPNDDVIDDSGYMRASTSSTSSTHQPLSQIHISTVTSLLQTAGFPFPVYSMLLATSTSPASVPLPLDCCGVAYLERLLQLDLPSSCLVLPQSGYSKKLLLSPPEYHVIGNFIALSDPESTRAFHGLQKPVSRTTTTSLMWRTHPFFFTTEGERIVGAHHSPTGRLLPFIHPQGDKLLSAHISLHCVDESVLPALPSAGQQMPTSTTSSPSKGGLNNNHHAEEEDDNFIVQIQASTTVGALQGASTQHALPISTTHNNNNTSTQEGGDVTSSSPSSFAPVPVVVAAVPTPKFLLTNAAVIDAFPTPSCVAGDKYVVANKVEIPSIKWSWRPPTAALNSSTLSVRGNCLNSNSASKHKCLLLVRDGRVVLSFCSCGTCATGYGGSLCRHAAALALQLSRTPSTQLPQLSSDTYGTDKKKRHAVGEGANDAEEDDDDDINENGVVLRAGVGAADLSTYVPSEPAVMQGMLPAFLLGGTKRSRARAGAKSGGGGASTTSPTSTRTSLPSKLISHLLGPNAPTERPLTTYFYFCRSRRAVVMKEIEEGKHSDETGANKTAKVAKILASMWHSLPADDKQVISDDCATFNTDIKAQWEAYMASDEYATVMKEFSNQQQAAAAMSSTPASSKKRGGGASPKRRSGGATIVLGGKRAREGGDDDAPTDDDTPDEDTLENIPGSQRVAHEFEQMHSEWRRDSNGNWICAWDDTDPPLATTTTTNTTTNTSTLSRTTAAGGAKVPTLHQAGKPAEATTKAMLGSYYPGDDEGNPSTSGLMNRAYTTGRLAAASSAASGSWGGAGGDETARGRSSSTVAPAHRSSAPTDPSNPDEGS